MKRGPMELIVIHFPGEVPGEKLVPELHRLVDADVVHIVDLTFVTRTPGGEVSRFELSERAGRPGYEALDEVLHSVEGLIADDDMAQIAEGVAPGYTAAVLLIEHVWSKRFADIVEAAGGQLAYSERIPPAVVEALVAAAK